jgi:RNA polymerase sigma-70 factor (ECF subfamily)
LEEKEYGGRTLEDIARELGMAPTAVRMQLSRARKTLREALKDDR